MVHHSIDLERVGNTTILRTEQGQKGHWHLSGGAITLAELLLKFGQHYTVSELMNYWYNAKKIFRKEQHAWGSLDCRKSALQRWRSTEPPGHQRHDFDWSWPAIGRRRSRRCSGLWVAVAGREKIGRRRSRRCSELWVAVASGSRWVIGRGRLIRCNGFPPLVLFARLSTIARRLREEKIMGKITKTTNYL